MQIDLPYYQSITFHALIACELHKETWIVAQVFRFALRNRYFTLTLNNSLAWSCIMQSPPADAGGKTLHHHMVAWRKIQRSRKGNWLCACARDLKSICNMYIYIYCIYIYIYSYIPCITWYPSLPINISTRLIKHLEFFVAANSRHSSEPTLFQLQYGFEPRLSKTPVMKVVELCWGFLWISRLLEAQ